MSDYLRYVLGADNSSSEFAQLQGLVADAGPDIPGGDGANEGFWRQQLRDRLGQFAKMFGLVLFDIEVEGIGRLTGHGELVDIIRPGVGVVRIKNHPILPDSDIEMLGDQLEAIDALIPDADFERVTGKTLPKNKAPELKDSITGDEALQKIYGQMGLHAKKSGRFAVGRSVKDVRAAAKEAYKPVYEKLKVEYPELMTDFPDYESYWEYASNSLAAGTFTRWADSVDDIPELTKASNKIYAREVLGLKEDGLIEFYRNSINHKSSPELAGAGYASLDRRMAWDYNSYLIKYEDNGLNETDGRYIVKAKPDEVTGLLGISGAEDEYGVVIGLDVTSKPGRTTRVGDLEMQQVAPWSNDIQTFDRSGGGSPFRRVSPASQFEVFATENPLPGSGYNDFYEAFNLDKESRPIPTKWDGMFGKGSFDSLNGEYPSYRSMQSLFIDAGDGKVGLDMMELDQISSRDSQNPEANDTYDKTLKMLSVIQELSGKTFMVHRGHNPDDPRLEQTTNAPAAPEAEPAQKLDAASGYSDAVQKDIEKSAILAPGESAGPAITPDLGNVESGYLDRYFDDNAELVDVVDGQDLTDLISAIQAKMLASDARTGDFNEEGIYDDNEDYWRGDAKNILYEQYKKVYDSLVAEDPELAKKFPTFPDFNRYLAKLAISDQLLVRKKDVGGETEEKTVPWEDAFTEEDRAMQKRINRRFAELILKLNPDGKIKIYRNAVSFSYDYETPETAAMGYWSYDRDFAYSFNPGTTKSGAWSNPNVGRYSATIAVDDIVGVIGLMRGGAGSNFLPTTDEMALSISADEVSSGALQDLTFNGRVRSVVKSGGTGLAEEVTAGLEGGATPFRYRNMANLLFQGVPVDSATFEEFEKFDPSAAKALKADGALITGPDGTVTINTNKINDRGVIGPIAKFQKETGKVLLVNNFNRSRDAVNLETETLYSPVTQNLVTITPSEIDSAASIPHVTVPDGVKLSPSEQYAFDSKAESLAGLLDPSRPDNWSTYNAVDDAKNITISKRANLIDQIRQDQLNIIQPAIDRKNEADKTSAETQAEKFKRDIESLQGLADSNRAYAEELRAAGDLEFAAIIDNAVKTYEEQIKELESGYDRNSNPGHEAIADRVDDAIKTLADYNLDGSIVDLLLGGASKEEIKAAVVKTALYKKREEDTKKYEEELAKYEAPTPPEDAGDFWSDPNSPAAPESNNSVVNYVLDKMFADDTRLTPEENQTQREQALKDSAQRKQAPDLPNQKDKEGITPDNSPIKTIDSLPSSKIYGEHRYRPASEIKLDIKSEDGELSSEELQAIDEYMSADYREINAATRMYPNLSGQQMLDSVDPATIKVAGQWTGEEYELDTTRPFETIQLLDSAFSNSALQEDEVVYRGVHMSPEDLQALLNLEVGSTVTDTGYLSTTTNLTLAQEYAERINGTGGNIGPKEGNKAVIYRIKALKGTPATQNPDLERGEDELILARNLNLKITGVSKTSKGVVVLDVETQPAESKPETPGERSTGLFNEYDSERADQITAEDTPLTDLGWEPDEEITIYRGVPDDVDSINSGDWVTALPQLARDYAGAGGKVISSKVKARDLYADPSVGPEAYKEEMVWRPKATKEISKDPKALSTTAIDTTGTRLSADIREELDSLISDFNVIDNEADSQAYRDIASELGRPLSLPWDKDRTPEGRETYEYIYSATKFNKDTPENDEEKELLRIKNLFNENLENNKDLQYAKKTLYSNKLYKDVVDALSSEINGFDEDEISFGLMDVGRNLSHPRPRLREDEIEEFLIESPDYADEEVNNLTYDVTVDIDESVEITNRDLKEFSETAAVSIILPSRALEEVLNTGRMKTVHETKYSLAGNSSEQYRALRVAYESLAFGYNGDSPMEERPVYGLLRSAELPMPEDALMIYGGRNPAQIILKPEAKSRTTISDRDSLNHFEPTTPLSDPKFEASHLTRMAAVYREATGENFFETENFAKYGSIEAQVHGGIKLEDIGKVLFYETPSEEIRELLTSKGIIWEVSRSKPYSKPRTFGGGMF